MKKISIIISIFTFLLFSAYANAQMQTSIDGVNISSFPDFPAEGTNVSISIESYLIDLDSASIVWMVNEKTKAHGVGMKEFQVPAPKIGSILNVKAIIKASNGREVIKTTAIKSGTVEIIWESKGYYPPFFKGKNLFSYQNTIHLVAFPHLASTVSNEINPKNIIYKWKLGGKYIENGSGQGRQSIDIQGDLLPKNLEISVEAYSQDQKEFAMGSIEISPTEPSIVFYEMNPLYGIMYNKAIYDSFSLYKTEVSLIASPYGFNSNKKGDNLEYTWSINDVEQPDLSKNQSITLKRDVKITGVSNINLVITNAQEIMQRAISSLSVDYREDVQ